MSGASGGGAGPLEGRPGLKTSRFLVGELHDLAVRNELQGAVLLTFKGDRVGVNSCGSPDAFGEVMDRLGEAILADFADGKYDAVLPANRGPEK